MVDVFQVQMIENGTKNTFSDIQTTNQAPLMFLDLKML